MSENKHPKADEKLEGGEIVVSNRFTRWLGNFWYHYKWTVLVVAFFLTVFLVCFVQCATRETPDLYIGYAGGFGYDMTGNQKSEIAAVLASVAPEGEASSIDLNLYSYLSEEELRTRYTDPETGALNEIYYQMKQTNMQNFNSLEQYMMTGDCAVWFVSETVYTEKKLNGELSVPLASTFGEHIPESAYDAYAIRLCETDLYKTYEALQVLPQDTLIVLTSHIVISDRARYDRAAEVYRAIVEFEAPIEETAGA